MNGNEKKRWELEARTEPALKKNLEIEMVALYILSPKHDLFCFDFQYEKVVKSIVVFLLQ